MKNRAVSRRGIALVAVIIFTSIFVILGFSILSLAETEIVLAQREVDSKKAFYAAEAGLEYGVAKLNNLLGEQRQAIDLDDEGDISARYEVPLPIIEDFTFDVFTIEKVGDVQTKVIESGPYKGMEALIQKYKITSEVTSGGSKPVSARLVQWVEDQRFHLFQFATFYDHDLEVEPGPPMTISGRIHSNNAIYLEAASILSIDSYLTCARNIYRGSKPGDPRSGSGTVEIKDADGVYQVMDFDSTDADWATKALETWDDRVQSQAHGISTLKVPMPIEDDQIAIIKPGETDDSEALKEARLYWQADLRIIDGVGYDKSGNVVDLTYEKDANSVNPVDMTKTLHSYREGKDIKITEIDISKLEESGKLPDNRILYVSTHIAGAGEQDGVRLVNGSALPASGLTVATDNPLYIQGDYNLNKAPASVLCDAINILSNSWQDGEGSHYATGTEINTCFAAGHSPTSEADGYGGGLENLPRFHENWSGMNLRLRGSMNSLWSSEIATGQWHDSDYSPPNRDWGFEAIFNLSNLPPGTPILCRTHRSSWREGL